MKTDVCILGGGIMGLATAYNIRKRSDLEVLVLDRYGVGNEYCSSNDINRVFRYSYGNDRVYTEMAVDSLKLWTQLEQESGKKLLVPTGLLLLHGDDDYANGFNEASYKTLSQMNLGADRLDKSELKRRFPQFRAEEAIFDHHGGALLASQALATLQSLAIASGVKIQRAEAQEIFSEYPPHVLTTDEQQVEFRKLVVTVGPWTDSFLNARLAPVQATRQQLIYFKPRMGMDKFRPGQCPVFFTDKHYGLPAAGIDGVKMSPKELAEKVDPETASRSVDEKQIADCRDACKRFVPDIADGEVIRTKVCLYDMTENSDFVLDKDPDNPNIVYGYGFSGHGFKFAPLIGKLLAGLALDEKPVFDLERFSAVPDRRRRPTISAHLGKGK